MSHLTPNPDGSISLTADRRLFSRAMVKDVAALLVQHCHVLLDLNAEGDVVVTFRPVSGETTAEDLRAAAGLFGNLLVSRLASRTLDGQARAVRNLVLARALDGALPPDDEVGERADTATEASHGR